MTPLVFDTAVNAAGFARGMNQIEGIAGKTGSRLAGIFAGPMAALTGALSVGGIVALGKGFLTAGAEMETFEVRLGTLMGSTSEAKARMQELYEFAAVTPFNTAQVVGAEVTLRGFGASAEAIMPGLIDLAAVMGMDLPQAAIDMGKAWNQGAAGMESDGAKVLRTMMQQRTATDLTKMSIEDFREVLVETLDTGAFAGGAARMATTFSGLVSNLEDSWAGFQRQVADAGLFDNVKEALALTLEGINANQDASKEWARIISDDLWIAVKGIAYTLAVAATGVDALRLGFNFMLAPLADAVILANDLAKRITDVDRMIAEKAGWDTVVAGLDAYRVGLDAVGERAAGVRDRAVDTVLALANAKTPIQTLQDLFAQIEASSKATADNTRDVGGGGGANTKGANGDEGKAEAEAWRLALDAIKRYAEAGEQLREAAGESAANTRANALELAILREQDPRHRIELQALADIEAVQAAMDQQAASQRALYLEMDAAAGESADKRLIAEQEYQAALVALNEDTASQIAIINEQKAQALQAENASSMADTMAAIRQSAETISVLFDAASTAAGESYDHQADTANKLREQLAAGDEWYTEAQKKELTDRIRSSEAAARRAFAIEKGAKLASATINTAAAVVSALANPPGPPYSIPQSIAAGVAGGIQIAAIAGQQPAFHTGYAPDEVPMSARILQNEVGGILTGQGQSAIGGPQAIRNANAGVNQAGGGPSYVVQVLGHDRQVLKYKKQAVRRGDAYTDAILAARVTPPWRRSRA